jgi:hypothetical protein
LQNSITAEAENIHHFLEDEHPPETVLPVGVAIVVLYRIFFSEFALLNASRIGANDFDAK